MMESSGSGSSRLERKMVEKNRRIHMKGLCLKLASLIPKEYITDSSKDSASQLDYLDQAESYIIKLREHIENLKRKRDLMMSIEGINEDMSIGMEIGFPLPVIEVRHQPCSLEVVLISGLKKSFKFNEVIGVLEEEGAEIVNASFSVVGDKIFHTVHSQVDNSRKEFDTGRLRERLKELIH